MARQPIQSQNGALGDPADEGSDFYDSLAPSEPLEISCGSRSRRHLSIAFVLRSSYSSNQLESLSVEARFRVYCEKIRILLFFFSVFIPTIFYMTSSSMILFFFFFPLPWHFLLFRSLSLTLSIFQHLKELVCLPLIVVYFARSLFTECAAMGKVFLV